jgi:hypothetical protein
MVVGVVIVALGAAASLAGLAGMRSGRSLAVWSGVLAVAGAAVAAGGLLLQDDPGSASWLIAPMTGAAISVVHGRTLFAAGGPFRT